jgi:hypothetical protein
VQLWEDSSGPDRSIRSILVAVVNMVAFINPIVLAQQDRLSETKSGIFIFTASYMLELSLPFIGVSYTYDVMV